MMMNDIKLFVSYAEDDGARRYVDKYVLATSTEHAIEILEENGNIPNTWGSKWIIEEFTCLKP